MANRIQQTYVMFAIIKKVASLQLNQVVQRGKFSLNDAEKDSLKLIDKRQ